MENCINLEELERKMLALGFCDNIKGTEMLRQAVQAWEPGMALTKELYPMVARKCGTTASRAERCMRHAIETAWERADVLTMESCFGYTVNPRSGTPTVGEFVSRMARVCSNAD